MTPTWTRTMSMGERLELPHASFEKAFRRSVCEDWLVPDHWHRLLRGDFGTSFYLDRFSFEDAERRGCGFHSYVCCLCYHTSTYCRLMWNDPPLDGGCRAAERSVHRGGCSTASRSLCGKTSHVPRAGRSCSGG